MTARARLRAVCTLVAGVVSCASLSASTCPEGVCADPTMQCANGVCLPRFGRSAAGGLVAGANCAHPDPSVPRGRRYVHRAQVNLGSRWYECWKLYDKVQYVCPHCGAPGTDLPDPDVSRDQQGRLEGPECDEYQRDRCARDAARSGR